MFKRFFCISIICLFSILFLGCTTVRRKNLEQQALRDRIHALEIQLQEREQEIMNLRDSLAREIKEKEDLRKKVTEKKTIAKVISRPNVRQIQIALKNAGYDPGKIDGKMGGKTREAIKTFQKANGLAADGKVGKLTWGLLMEYLYMTSK